MINGKHCTIIWHVDDLKISHVDSNVMKDIINTLNKKFGQENPLTTCQGKILEYLGMKINYTKQGKLKFTMYE